MKVTIVKNPHSTLPSDISIVEDASVSPHHLILRTDTHDVIVNVKTGKMSKQKRVKFEPLPGFGDHMMWEEFCAGVATGGLTDEDGEGQLATLTQMSNITAPLAWASNKIHHSGSDSDIAAQKLKPPHDWATHVVWFNK